MTNHDGYRPFRQPQSRTVMLKATVSPTGRIERISVEVRSPAELLFRIDHRDPPNEPIHVVDIEAAYWIWRLLVGDHLELLERPESP